MCSLLMQPSCLEQEVRLHLHRSLLDSKALYMSGSWPPQPPSKLSGLARLWCRMARKAAGYALQAEAVARAGVSMRSGCG